VKKKQVKQRIRRCQSGTRIYNQAMEIVPYRLVRARPRNFFLQIYQKDGTYKTVLETKEESFLITLLAKLYGYSLD
jgi:hypothetical protein